MLLRAERDSSPLVYRLHEQHTAPALTDLVVPIVSLNIRGHVLSSNDPNRNHAGPPAELGSLGDASVDTLKSAFLDAPARTFVWNDIWKRLTTPEV